MELLRELSERDIGYPPSGKADAYRLRKAARAVIQNTQDEIALLYVSKHRYHKLPGGGLEPGEEMTEALKREVLEEVGAEIEITSEIGLIIEFRDQLSLVPFVAMRLTYEGPNI